MRYLKGGRRWVAKCLLCGKWIKVGSQAKNLQLHEWCNKKSEKKSI